MSIICNSASNNKAILNCSCLVSHSLILALSSRHGCREGTLQGQRSPDWGQCAASVCPHQTTLLSVRRQVRGREGGREGGREEGREREERKKEERIREGNYVAELH